MRVRRARGRRGPLGLGDAAGSAMLGLVVATGIVTATMGVALVLQERMDPTAAAREDELSYLAEGALAALLGSPGEPPNWEQGGAPIERLGVSGGIVNGVRVVDAAKLDAARDLLAGGGSLDEFKAALGLDGVHVRVRVTPTFVPVANGTVVDVAPLRVAYVADHDGGRESATSVRERAHLAATGAAFDPTEAETVEHRGVGGRFRDDAATLATHLVPRLAGFEAVTYSGGSGSELSEWTVLDKAGFAAAVPDSADWWASLEPERVLTPGKWGGGALDGFTMTSGRTHSLTVGVLDLSSYAGGEAALEFTHWLEPSAHGVLVDEASVVATCLSCVPSTESVLWSWAPAPEHGVVPGRGAKGAFVRESVDLEELLGEEVLVRLEYERHAVGLGLPVSGEGWFIGSVHANATPPAGDGAQPAAVALYSNVLDYSTSRFDGLVVGSDVDHAALAAADRVVASAVLDWTRGGGRLLVLGSDEAGAADWMSPVLTEPGAPGATSGLLARESDLSHPLVASPHALRVAQLDYADAAYRESGTFVRVLAGASGSSAESLLAARTPDDEFAGSAVLTSARPGGEGNTDGFRSLVNWLAFLARGRAQVDAGEAISPALPFGYAAVPAVMTDPAWDDNVVLEATIQVWN